jgi:hypothetical protein
VIVFVLILILLRLTDYKKKRVMILFISIYHIYITSTNIACFKLFFILALLNFFWKVHKLPLNYLQIDNVSSKLLIVTMSPSNYQNIVNIPQMTKLPSVKKILKLLEKKHKTKKKIKKNPKGVKLKIKKANPLYKKKMN